MRDTKNICLKLNKKQRGTHFMYHLVSIRRMRYDVNILGKHVFVLDIKWEDGKKRVRRMNIYVLLHSDLMIKFYNLFHFVV